MQYFSAAVESYSFLTAETAFAIVYQYMIRTVPVHNRTDRQRQMLMEKILNMIELLCIVSAFISKFVLPSGGYTMLHIQFKEPYYQEMCLSVFNIQYV